MIATSLSAPLPSAFEVRSGTAITTVFSPVVRACSDSTAKTADEGPAVFAVLPFRAAPGLPAPLVALPVLIESVSPHVA